MNQPQASEVTPGHDQVRIERDGALLRITLNRPRALNALSHSMVRQIAAALEAAQYAARNDPHAPQVIILRGEGDRGFCGGGDVKELTAAAPHIQREFLGDEYLLDLALAESELPIVSVMHGVTMGGGIGLAGHASTRIVTESATLAMPEARIGIVPDVGGSLLLSRAPGRLGELLTITAGTFGAGDALALGFADAFVPSENLSRFEALLAAGRPVAEAVSEVSAQPPVSPLMRARAWWDQLADQALGSAPEVWANPAAAAQRLLVAMEQSPHREAREAAQVVARMCPVSVAVGLAQLARVRHEGLGLAEVLADDHRLLGRLTQRADFTEGVRAQLVDRDGAPKWLPASLGEVSDELVRDLANPVLREGEVGWPGAGAGAAARSNTNTSSS